MPFCLPFSARSRRTTAQAFEDVLPSYEQVESAQVVQPPKSVHEKTAASDTSSAEVSENEQGEPSSGEIREAGHGGGVAAARTSVSQDLSEKEAGERIGLLRRKMEEMDLDV